MLHKVTQKKFEYYELDLRSVVFVYKLAVKQLRRGGKEPYILDAITTFLLKVKLKKVNLSLYSSKYSTENVLLIIRLQAIFAEMKIILSSTTRYSIFYKRLNLFSV